MLRFRELAIAGAWLVEMEPQTDDRGAFGRYFCHEEARAHGLDRAFVQFNHSRTDRCGSVRGLHLQIGAAAEDKLVKCVRGRVLDVLVDTRAGSATLLRHVTVDLAERLDRAVYIPRGVAHGFQTLVDDCELIYHHSNVYVPEAERGLRYDDPRLAIAWPLPVTDISAKDRDWPLLTDDFAGFPGAPA